MINNELRGGAGRHSRKNGNENDLILGWETLCSWARRLCKTTFKEILLIYTAIKHYPVGKLKKRQKSSVDLITNSLPGPNRAELPFN